MADAPCVKQPANRAGLESKVLASILLPSFMPSPTEKGSQLALFANQDTEVFFDQLSPTIDCLARQYAKKLYKPAHALRAFQRVANTAAVVYERIYGDAHLAERGLSSCFTRLDQENAGAQLLVMNAPVLEKAIREALKKRGGLA